LPSRAWSGRAPGEVRGAAVRVVCRFLRCRLFFFVWPFHLGVLFKGALALTHVLVGMLRLCRRRSICIVVVVFGRRKSVLLALAMDPHGMSHALM